jgi:hypothetical protein
LAELDTFKSCALWKTLMAGSTLRRIIRVWIGWGLRNMGRFALLLLGVAFASEIVKVVTEGTPLGYPPWGASALFEAIALSWFLLIMGAPLYLIVVGVIPSTWQRFAQRLAAIAASPIVVAFLLWETVPDRGGLHPTILLYEIVFPLLCGLVVRLPAHKSGRAERMDSRQEAPPGLG